VTEKCQIRQSFGIGSSSEKQPRERHGELRNLSREPLPSSLEFQADQRSQMEAWESRESSNETINVELFDGVSPYRPRRLKSYNMGRPIGRQVVTVHSHFMGNLGIRHITWRNLMNMTFVSLRSNLVFRVVAALPSSSEHRTTRSHNDLSSDHMTTSDHIAWPPPAPAVPDLTIISWTYDFSLLSLLLTFNARQAALDYYHYSYRFDVSSMIMGIPITAEH
jgi:hypothetical protein